jgi:uncharacterized LabA/DUF88 family protein
MKVFKILLLFVFIGNALGSCAQKLKKDTFEYEKNELEKAYYNDIKYRNNTYITSLKQQDSLDKQNLEIVSKILDSLGWLSKADVGETANMAIFLVIQHSNIIAMEKYLPVMKKAVAEKKADKQALALLIDRVEMLNNRKQIYGSQLVEKDGKYISYDMIEPTKVNERRKEMGLESIEDYLKRFAK